MDAKGRKIQLENIKSQYSVLNPHFNERVRRLWAGGVAHGLERGGVALVSEATGLARQTVSKGRDEFIRQKEAPEDSTEKDGSDSGRIRAPGAGRPSLKDTQPGILEALEKLVDPVTRGDPTSPLRWTRKSCSNLAEELRNQGFKVSLQSVWRMLKYDLGYSLQSLRKVEEGAAHPCRDEQFNHINNTADEYLTSGDPVISVDTKKKENVGNFSNVGREWQPKGKPQTVMTHDFPSAADGKATPYGVYDMGKNSAFVNVGCDHDTPAFAVASIRKWWELIGRENYGKSKRLYITADAGGSNGYRCRAWKLELQKFSNETGLTIEVSHFPPGTSKWNKIEHRLFCHITRNIRGTPLKTLETIVERIGNTRTDKGLIVKSEIDLNEYPKGVKITKQQMKIINLITNRFQGDWNYVIKPNTVGVICEVSLG